MTIIFIVAAAENDVIGRDGKIPWHLPDDLKHFKELTEGHPVIMGRKTFESILRLRSGPSVGPPLPNRRNIVITRQHVSFDGCEVVHSLEEALNVCAGEPEVWVIGGGEVYRAALPRADRIELTRVHANIDGDAFFPEVDSSQWQLKKENRHESDERHAYPFTFQTYDRIIPA